MADEVKVENEMAVAPPRENPGADGAAEKKLRKKPRPRGTGSLFLCGEWWHCAFYESAGRQVTRSCRTRVKREAEEFLQKQLERVRAGTFSTRADRVRVGELFEDLVRDFEVKRLRTTSDLLCRLKRHLAPFLDCAVVEAEGSRPRFSGGVLAASISNDHGQKYTLQRRAEGASDGSVILELAVLLRALRLGLRNRKLLRAPEIDMPPEPHARRGFLEPDQYRTLLAALPEWLRPLVAVAYWSGMRRGELCSLTWDHVRLDESRPHIRLEQGETKNGEGRTIPLAGEALELVRMQKALRDANFSDCPYVFFRPARRCERRPPTWRRAGDFSKTWRSATEAVRVPGLLLHDLRRSAVRNLVRAGVPQSVAMSISGHKTPSVFMRYDITSGDERFEAMERVGRYVEQRAQEASVPQTEPAEQPQRSPLVN